MSDLQEERVQRSDIPIRDIDIDDDFKYEIAGSIGGEGLLRCLKCGACSGGCPVSAVTDYRPRKVLGNVLLGLKDQVLSSKDIWMCAACFTCEERCVQEVNFTDVITVLRNMAVQKNHAPKGYAELARNVTIHGRVAPKTGAVDKHREKLGLPILQEPALDKVQKIIEYTGFDKTLRRLLEGGDES
ncbi:MAG: 4Fe-4S dicluster domain-containing protein [Candidatus Thorarchaeota archaeon]